MVSAVVLRIQRMERSLESELIPYGNGSLNAKPFATDDLFQLVPVKQPCEFPGDPTATRQVVPGFESLVVCEVCTGASYSMGNSII